MLVDQCQGNRVVTLPAAQFSEVERQPIRQFLRSHISRVRSDDSSIENTSYIRARGDSPECRKSRAAGYSASYC